MSDTSSSRFVDDLNNAIRENPVAASLIGMGALWMFFGGAKIPAFAPGLARAAAGAVGSAAQAGGNAASGISAAGNQAVTSVRQAASRAADTGADILSSGYETASEALGDAGDVLRGAFKTSATSGKEFSTSLQKNLTETLERQPLVLGAIGLAIGAGIASAFPATPMEKDLMGESSATVRAALDGATRNATEFAQERAGEVLEEVKTEAATQGLTPTGAAEALMGVKEKAKAVASTARESVKAKLT